LTAVNTPGDLAGLEGAMAENARTPGRRGSKWPKWQFWPRPQQFSDFFVDPACFAGLAGRAILHLRPSVCRAPTQ